MKTLGDDRRLACSTCHHVYDFPKQWRPTPLRAGARCRAPSWSGGRCRGHLVWRRSRSMYQTDPSPGRSRATGRRLAAEMMLRHVRADLGLPPTLRLQWFRPRMGVAPESGGAQSSSSGWFRPSDPDRLCDSGSPEPRLLRRRSPSRTRRATPGSTVRDGRWPTGAWSRMRRPTRRPSGPRIRVRKQGPGQSQGARLDGGARNPDSAPGRPIAMKPRKTYRRLARKRWPGSYIRGAGCWAVLEDWPDSQSGLAVWLYYSETLARDMAASIGVAYEYENGDASPVRVYDLTKWRSES